MTSSALQSGYITTVVGTGNPDYTGEGGPATEAALNEPKAVAVDRAGHLYVVDSENHLIRKVDAGTGQIRTIAGRPRVGVGQGSGTEAPSGSVPLPSADDPFGEPAEHKPDRYVQVSDLSGTVRFVTGKKAKGPSQYHGDGGPATEALLNFPSAIAVATDGTLYIADTMNHRVRRVDGRTGEITTLAGTGHPRCSGDGGPARKAALNEPNAVALDESRQCLYVADQNNNRVRRLDLATGFISTIAGTGEAGYNGDGLPATEASVAGPSGLAVGSDGTLYIADTFNGRIRAVDPENGSIRTVTGDGSQYQFQGLPNEWSTSVSRPHAIALDPEGGLYLTDSDSHLIRRWDARKKIITRIVGTGRAQYGGDGAAAIEASLNYPFGVALDAQGNLYIADTFNHRIRKVSA